MWSGIGLGEEDVVGGGYVYCGIMVYLGDNWFFDYCNLIFMNNIYG